MRTLLVTPMQEELDFFLDYVSNFGFTTRSTVAGRLPVFQAPELGLLLACGGIGKAQFALQTQYLIDHLSVPDLVICAGAAGALVADLSIGDVVVGTETVEHDFNNKFSTRPLPRFEGSGEIISRLKASDDVGDIAVRFGIVASGDEDVVARQRGETLHQVTGAIAVAWEGAGGARACVFNDIPFLEIRGISDTADHNAVTDFKSNLELAMGNVATLVIALLNGLVTKR